MTDRKPLADKNETPEDVATLYSWANLHGAKYRDFSASRAQTRENARLRVEQAIESERRRSQQETEAQRAAEAERAASAVREAEAVEREAEEGARRQAVQASQEAVRLAAQQTAQQRGWQQPRPERLAVPTAAMPAPAYPAQLSEPDLPAFSAGHLNRVVSSTPAPASARMAPFAALHEENHAQPGSQWAGAEPRAAAGRPAWLAPDRAESAAPIAPPAQDETLQGSRDRLTSRWFALKGVFEGAMAPAEAVAAPSVSRAPILAVFSLAGGVGKTSLVATLGRALSARGERVLLVDTAAYGLLPFFFGARDQRPGVLRTFSPPGASGDAPVQLITIDPEGLAPDSAGQDALAQEIARNARGAGRVLVDLATASGATTRRILKMAPTVLVPVVPDMSSVVSVGSIEAFFQKNSSAAGKPVSPYYVLNQFDPSLPLHLDVREVLREQLGDRLLPFALRRTPAVSEALAEGMTVVDYAPNSNVAEDFGSLAAWVKSLAAPAGASYRGVRWSER